MTDNILNQVIVDADGPQLKKLLERYFRELSESEMDYRPYATHDFLWEEVIPMPRDVYRESPYNVRLWQIGNWGGSSAGRNRTMTNFGVSGSFNFSFPSLDGPPVHV